jgi:hypothetical protein
MTELGALLHIHGMRPNQQQGYIPVSELLLNPTSLRMDPDQVRGDNLKQIEILASSLTEKTI